MKIYCGLMGGGCLLYYFILYFYTKRWKTTFSVFWPIMGAVHLLLGILPLTGWMNKAVGIMILFMWIIFLVIEVQIWTAMKKKAPNGIPYLIVLGAQVRGSRITNSLMRRLETACIYLEGNPLTRVIVSGGQGRGEDISEAKAMSGYLQQHGIGAERILMEDASTSTWENLKFSSRFIEDKSQPVAIVTNNFHLYRALLIGRKVGFSNLHGIAASSNMVFQLNYLVREFFAVIWMKLSRK